MESKAFFLFLAFALCITYTRQQHLQTGVDQGSGYSGDNDVDEEYEKVTHAFEESGFGAVHLTPCQKQRISPGVDGFRPQCTSDGRFRPIQCRSGRCWCVDENGVKTSQPDASLTVNSKCNNEPIIERARKPTYAAPLPDVHNADDFSIEEVSTFRPMYSERFTSAKTSRMQSTTVAVAEKNAFVAFLLKDPLLFAGIVGGVVFALLWIILAVMFTIYRMRKKDEGSYALDEPKKSYGIAYTKAEEKEFFA